MYDSHSKIVYSENGPTPEKYFDIKSFFRLGTGYLVFIFRNYIGFTVQNENFQTYSPQ